MSGQLVDFGCGIVVGFLPIFFLWLIQKSESRSLKDRLDHRQELLGIYQNKNTVLQGKLDVIQEVLNK